MDLRPIDRRVLGAALMAVLLGALDLTVIATILPGMVAGRAIQGAGGGALLPVTMAIVGDLLPPGRRAAALGLVGAVDTLGWVLGPIWGAMLVEVAPGQDPWRWVFIVNVPLAVAAAIAIGRVGEAKPTIGKGWM